VGYSAADVREILQDTWAYMQCEHDDDASSSDFFGLNSYSWCSPEDTMETSSYSVLVDMFKDSAIPVFVSLGTVHNVCGSNTDNLQFSEYGCNEIQPRAFTEVGALYGSEMRALSGGLVYEYSHEEQDYGLVEIHQNGSVTLFKDFDNLQDQFNKLDISAIESTNPQSTNIQPPECDAGLITADEFSKNFTIPAVCPGCQDIIDNGIENAQNGKLVQVKDRKVKQEVYGSNGQQVQGLELNVRDGDESNTPGGENTSPSSTGDDSDNPTNTGSGSQPSETEEGAAAHLGVSTALIAAALFAYTLL
jgi:hypothetical protein